MSLTDRRRSRPGRPRRMLLVLPVAAVAAGGCAPEGVTTQGADIHNLYNFFLAAAAVVFVLVTGLVLWSVVRYRRRGDELPKQTHGSTKLEVTWTVLPAALVVVLFVATLQTQNRVTDLAEDAPVEISVLGFQWSWRFTYTKVPGGGPGPEVVGTPNQIPELAVPLGQTVRIRLESADVVHSFYVPRALFKRQAIPGRVSEFDMTFEEPGVYPGNCAQYCGLSHSQMVFNVRVLPPQQFQQWIEDRETAGGGGT